MDFWERIKKLDFNAPPRPISEEQRQAWFKDVRERLARLDLEDKIRLQHRPEKAQRIIEEFRKTPACFND